jgi:hypothetical protein
MRAAARLKSVALFAGERKLHEWNAPPYAVTIATAELEGAVVRASVIDENGAEATDRQ